MDQEDRFLEAAASSANAYNFETEHEPIFTPETFSPQRDVPSELLEVSLNFPYSVREWDVIFDTLIDLLGYQDYRVWTGAIDRLIQALEAEESQSSDCEEYQPRATSQRLERIFEAIVQHSVKNPQLFEAFCREFRVLAMREPYRGLGLRWLVQLTFLEDRQVSLEAIERARRLFQLE
jgi:hypothetical protein